MWMQALLAVVGIKYGMIFSTGKDLGNHMRWKYCYACLMLLCSSVAGRMINRILYRKTHNVFGRPAVYGVMTTVFIASCMMVPDYLYKLYTAVQRPSNRSFYETTRLAGGFSVQKTRQAPGLPRRQKFLSASCQWMIP